MQPPDNVGCNGDALITLDHLSHLGDALRILRAKARMTQAEICARTGLKTPQLSRWENGREVPTLESVVKFLNAVGADLTDLQNALTGREDKERGAKVNRELAKIRAQGERRLAESLRLRGTVRELLRPNADGLERLERRIRSLEEKLGDDSQPGEE